ncbi:hypothetical protein HerbRD11066_10290 [Herbidospora sp. RD11066]
MGMQPVRAAPHSKAYHAGQVARSHPWVRPASRRRQETTMIPGCGSCNCSDEILSTLRPPRITQLGTE